MGKTKILIIGILFIFTFFLLSCDQGNIILVSDHNIAAPLESVKLSVENVGWGESTYIWYIDGVEIGESTTNEVFLQLYVENNETHEITVDVKSILSSKSDTISINFKPYLEIDSATLTLKNTRGLTMRNLVCAQDFAANIYQNLISNSPLFDGESITLNNLKPGWYFFEWGNDPDSLQSGIGDTVYPGDNFWNCPY